MAFEVTPSSGSQPYLFTVAFDNKHLFGNDFAFEFAQVTDVGFCSNDYNLGNNAPVIAVPLFETGSYTWSSTSVPAGSCRSVIVRVRRLSDNSIVQGIVQTIDNL